MGRGDRHDGMASYGSADDASERVEETGEEAVGDTQDRVRRLATDTAELLIVHDGGEGEPTLPEPTHSERYLDALRKRVDTGEYAVLPRVVAEAMVRKADRLKE